MEESNKKTLTCLSPSDHVYVVGWAEKTDNSYQYDLKCSICSQKSNEQPLPMRKNINPQHGPAACQSGKHDWQTVIPPLPMYHRYCWDCNACELKDRNGLPEISNGSMICPKCKADGSKDHTVWQYYGNLLFGNMLRYECSKCEYTQNFHGKLPHERLPFQDILANSSFVFGNAAEVIKSNDMTGFSKEATIGYQMEGCMCDFCGAQSERCTVSERVGNTELYFVSHRSYQKSGWQIFKFKKGDLIAYLDACPDCIRTYNLPPDLLKDAMIADYTAAATNNKAAQTVGKMKMAKDYER